MHHTSIDYFAEPSTPEERVLSRIKGNFRRRFVAKAIDEHGLDSVPPQWMAHDLPELLKSVLQRDNPSYRGGEDLPDLEPGEVEIARLSLIDSVHGEVTSVRGRRAEGGAIDLRVVNEYGDEFTLPYTQIGHPFSADQLIDFLSACTPCPFTSECRVQILSRFYDELQTLLDALLKKKG